MEIIVKNKREKLVSTKRTGGTLSHPVGTNSGENGLFVMYVSKVTEDSGYFYMWYLNAARFY